MRQPGGGGQKPLDQCGLGPPVECLRAGPERGGQIEQKLAADSAPVVLDEVQVGRGHIDASRQFGLLEAHFAPSGADTAAGQLVLVVLQGVEGEPDAVDGSVDEYRGQLIGRASNLRALGH